jgi:hypothetical protein
MTLLAVWLMTSLRPEGVSIRLKTIVRWVPTILVGLAVGLSTTIQKASDDVRASYWAASMMLFVEAPSTVLVYCYLSMLARARELESSTDVKTLPGGWRLSRTLSIVAYASVLIILAPLAFFALSRSFSMHRYHPATLVIAGVYGAMSIALGVIAWSSIVRLTWMLATWHRTKAGVSHRKTGDWAATT